MNLLPISRMEDEADEPRVDFTLPSTDEILRYRYHYGCNFGSNFVLERWLTPHMFPGDPDGYGESELFAVRSWEALEGTEKTRERFQKHWDHFISEDDLNWIKDVGKCNTIRLPIGYWIVAPKYLDQTPFKEHADVYIFAWASVAAIVRKCHCRGIGVYLDLHCVPGAANPHSHSGTDSGEARLWNDEINKRMWLHVLRILLRLARGMRGVVGVGIVNESETGHPTMYEWYSEVLAELAKVDPTMPIYISDCWNLPATVDWSHQHNSLKEGDANPVVIDTHYYRCMSDEDKRKTPKQILGDLALPSTRGNDGDVVGHGAAQIVVGEYCGNFGGETLLPGDAYNQELVKAFGDAQCQEFQHATGGQFFWTFGSDSCGEQWSFRSMREQGFISPPEYMKFSRKSISAKLRLAIDMRIFHREKAITRYHGYRNEPIESRKYWRFAQG